MALFLYLLISRDIQMLMDIDLDRGTDRDIDKKQILLLTNRQETDTKRL